MAKAKMNSASVGGDHQLIALVITRRSMLAYPELLPELLAQLERRSLRGVLLQIERESDCDAALTEALVLDVAGVICAVRPSEVELLALADHHMPTLLYNCHAQGPTVDSVSCDHAACGQMLATTLLRGGHRRFGLISAAENSLVGTERIAGAIDALRRSNALAVEVALGDYSYASGAAAVDWLFARMKPRPSAIIACNDAMAIGALDRARQLQVRVPRDLSIVGIDGTEAARLPSYDLTTIRQPLAPMAAAAVDQLVARIAEPDRGIEIRLFSGELIVGSTARLERPVRKPVHAAVRR